MATLIFIALFLLLPLLVLVWMTIERRRSRANEVRGFEVKLSGDAPEGLKERENDHG
jgi:hypothetical protein